MRTALDAKQMAKSLRAELRARKGIDASHAECLEIVARQFGLDDWNVLAVKIQSGDQPMDGTTPSITTMPVLRVFSEEKARQFYLDFLGFTLDFGGPAEGPGTPFYGQISRVGTTMHLAEHQYDPAPGSTVIIWVSGLQDLYDELHRRKDHIRVWGPAVWMPSIEELPWEVRSLSLPDPFGNVLRFYEPTNPAAHPDLPLELPRWVGAG